MVTPEATAGRPAARAAAWLARPHGRFGIRCVDVAATLVVIGLVEINVVVGYGPGPLPARLASWLPGAQLVR